MKKKIKKWRPRHEKTPSGWLLIIFLVLLLLTSSFSLFFTLTAKTEMGTALPPTAKSVSLKNSKSGEVGLTLLPVQSSDDKKNS